MQQLVAPVWLVAAVDQGVGGGVMSGPGPAVDCATHVADTDSVLDRSTRLCM